MSDLIIRGINDFPKTFSMRVWEAICMRPAPHWIAGKDLLVVKDEVWSHEVSKDTIEHVVGSVKIYLLTSVDLEIVNAFAKTVDALELSDYEVSLLKSSFVGNMPFTMLEIAFSNLGAIGKYFYQKGVVYGFFRTSTGRGLYFEFGERDAPSPFREILDPKFHDHLTQTPYLLS